VVGAHKMVACRGGITCGQRSAAEENGGELVPAGLGAVERVGEHHLSLGKVLAGSNPREEGRGCGCSERGWQFRVSARKFGTGARLRRNVQVFSGR